MLGVELKVHSLAQDGVLLSRWSLFCFLLQLHPLSAAFVPPGAESASARHARAWAHGPVGGRPSLGTGSAELSAGPGGPLVASVGQGGAFLAASWGQGPWPSVQASGQNPTEVRLISVLTRGARPRAGRRGCLLPRPLGCGPPSCPSWAIPQPAVCLCIQTSLRGCLSARVRPTQTASFCLDRLFTVPCCGVGGEAYHTV